MGPRQKKDTWADVCFKNVVIFMKALEIMGISTNALLQALPERVGKTRDALKRFWGTLDEFNEVLDAVVAELGHPWRLVEVGRLSNHVSFGLETVQRWFLKFIFRWVTDPSIGVSMIPTAARTLNQNKAWRPLLRGKAARNRQIYRITYNDGPKGQSPRSTIEDRRSLLYFVRGVLEAIVPMWPRQAEIGFVQYLVIQIPAIELIQAELPEAEVRLAKKPKKAALADDQCEPTDWQLLIDGQVYGEVVYLLRNPEAGDEYTGDYKVKAAPEDDFMSLVPAICMTQDLRTVCRATDESLPLMREGEIYEWPETRLPCTTVELRWKSGLLQRLIGRFIGRSVASDFEASAQQEKATADAQQESADERLMSRLGEWHLSTNFPTDRIAREVTAGTFNDLRILCCIIYTDVVKSQDMDRRMQPGEKTRLLRQVVGEQIVICRQHGGWYYKYSGDGGIFIFTSGWEDQPRITMREAVEAAVAAAAEMETAAAKRGVQIRVGVHMDQATWFIFEDRTTLEGNGPALDNGKRIEEVCPDGRIAVSAAAIEVLGSTEGFGPEGEYRDKNGYPHRVRVLLKPGEVAPPAKGTVRIMEAGDTEPREM